MLVIARRLQEKLVFGENAEIKVSVLNIKGKQVRLGIEAPDDVAIYREEVWLCKNTIKNRGTCK